MLHIAVDQGAHYTSHTVHNEVVITPLVLLPNLLSKIKVPLIKPYKNYKTAHGIDIQ